MQGTGCTGGFTSMLWTSTKAGCPSEGRLGTTLMSWPPGPNRAQT